VGGKSRCCSLRRRAPDLPPPLAGEPDLERYRLFEAVVGLLTEISGSAPDRRSDCRR